MAFLFAPKARAYYDESLESYLLRVLNENFFDSFQQLALAIREELHELDFEAHGAFPVELNRLNVYHAKQNSHFRMRALTLLESLLGLPEHEIRQLVLFRSDRQFINAIVAVYRNGVDVPLQFLRSSTDEQTSIPVCPQCLAEAAYIRQVWHLKPYNACAKHGIELLHQCPKCQLPVNYIVNESITTCCCGHELAGSDVHQAERSALALSRNLIESDGSSSNPLFSHASASQRMAALLWFQKRFNKSHDAFTEAVDYFEDWPNVYYSELETIEVSAKLKLLDAFNRTSFRTVYGDLIKHARCLYPDEYEPHFIYLATLEYLEQLVARHPKTRHANIADTLLSIAETAVVLNTTHEQVYRLYQDGILHSAIRQSLHKRIDPNEGVFFLRQVIEYRSSFGGVAQRMYLSTW